MSTSLLLKEKLQVNSAGSLFYCRLENFNHVVIRIYARKFYAFHIFISAGGKNGNNNGNGNKKGVNGNGNGNGNRGGGNNGNGNGNGNKGGVNGNGNGNGNKGGANGNGNGRGNTVIIINNSKKSKKN